MYVNIYIYCLKLISLRVRELPVGQSVRHNKRLIEKYNLCVVVGSPTVTHVRYILCPSNDYVL